jgi:hypothetical protein
MAVSAVPGIIIKEKPLSDEIQEIAEGKSEAPEY